ncbi:MAG: hypothetical protein H6Q90_6015 [Deltaproteobacteria bacterium]|nr:hypothetical protein [Deltaproteobacteria bacterium]
MRTLWVVAVVAMVAGLASADSKGVRAYQGQIVISPDPAPSTSDELAGYLKANATKDRRYDLIKGPPWEINLVGVLPKRTDSAPVTLVFAAVTDKQPNTTIQSIEVPAKKGLVIAHTTATIAAGFESNRTYVVRLMRKTKVLARAELTLRD